jgi:hypothetical protein
MWYVKFYNDFDYYRVNNEIVHSYLFCAILFDYVLHIDVISYFLFPFLLMLALFFPHKERKVLIYRYHRIFLVIRRVWRYQRGNQNRRRTDNTICVLVFQNCILSEYSIYFMNVFYARLLLWSTSTNSC